jgi:hypothetical protein
MARDVPYGLRRLWYSLAIMRKVLAILAVFIVMVFGAARASCAGPAAPPSAQQPTALTCDEACQQGRENLAIQRKLELFTGGLVVVGLLQVGSMVWQAILLNQTRGDVHTQAGWMKTQTEHMGRQTEILDGSVDVAKKSANAAEDGLVFMKAKERARLTITPFKFKNSKIVPYDFNEVILHVTNDGLTSALNVRGECSIKTTPAGSFDTPPSVMKIPSLIKPNVDNVFVAALFVDEHDLNAPDLEEPGVAYKRFLIEICGTVYYEDVFGERHKTAFRHSIRPYSVRIEDLEQVGWKSWQIAGTEGWLKSGDAEENRAT